MIVLIMCIRAMLNVANPDQENNFACGCHPEFVSMTDSVAKRMGDGQKLSKDLEIYLAMKKRLPKGLHRTKKKAKTIKKTGTKGKRGKETRTTKE
ncbi:hypothetical protein Tco_0709424 [Tanacetum coccineum]